MPEDNVKKVQEEKEKGSNPKKREGSPSTLEPKKSKGFKRFKSSVKLLMTAQSFIKRSKKPQLDRVKLAYPGSIGSFAELAAKEYFDQCKEVKYVGAGGFEQVFDDVESGKVNFGILPIENSRSGVLTKTLDLLVNRNLFIVGETTREEGHYLCALPGVAKKDIKRVYSHPHLLAQCKKFLTTLKEENKSLDQICMASSSAAVSIIKADQDKNGAAIASKEAAEHSGMIILSETIADYHPIASRYLILSKKKAEFTNTRDLKLKTSICISCSNEKGSLFKVLSCFALRGLEINSIHSRPSSTIMNDDKLATMRHWDLIFYIDYTPSQDAMVNQALMDNIREYTERVQEFGTFEENNINKRIDQWYTQDSMLDAVYY